MESSILVFLEIDKSVKSAILHVNFTLLFVTKYEKALPLHDRP